MAFVSSFNKINQNIMYNPNPAFNDPRIISCDIEYQMDYNFSQEATATIKVKVDPAQIKNLRFSYSEPENVMGMLLQEGDNIIFKRGQKETILGPASDPDSYKKIYMYYIDDLYTK